MSSIRRVRVGNLYHYDPVLIDRTSRHTHHIEPGLYVRVINMTGCPPANTMGHCYIENMLGEFLGLVCCNSLVDLDAATRRKLRKQWRNAHK